jgi:hypothetical protein
VGQDDETYTSDLGILKTRIFLRAGLDRANRVDPVQEIKFFMQVLVRDEFGDCAASTGIFPGLPPGTGANDRQIPSRLINNASST